MKTKNQFNLKNLVLRLLVISSVILMSFSEKENNGIAINNFNQSKKLQLLKLIFTRRF